MSRFVSTALVFLVGICAGGYLFSSTLPRPFITVSGCESRCIRPTELAGLLASAGIQKMTAALPGIVAESNECAAIRHPVPAGKVHFVLFPRRDIRDIADLTDEDRPFVIGCLALAGKLIRDEKIENYRLHTNGPGLQHVTYLHFHIVAK